MSLGFALSGKRVWVAGHRGLVGSALMRRLASEDCELLTAGHAQLDLRRQEAVEDWVAQNRPDAVFLAAAHVGGILANATYPGEFLYDNLAIASHVIEAARRGGVKKLLFLGSSCIYPRLASQPIAESALLTGPLEPTNEWYAIAKIAGLKLAEAYRKQYGCDFISAMPTNLYGPGDNFDPLTGHVLAALIRKTHDARRRNESEIVIWGSGTPRREFLHADDCADALVFLMRHPSEDGLVNVGCGEDIAILDLARLVAEVVGFHGDIRTDPARPDGTPRKLLDTGRLTRLGWRPRIGLREGIAGTYRWFLDREKEAAVINPM